MIPLKPEVKCNRVTNSKNDCSSERVGGPVLMIRRLVAIYHPQHKSIITVLLKFMKRASYEHPPLWNVIAKQTDSDQET